MVRHRLIRTAALAGVLTLSAAAATDSGSGGSAGSGGLDARGAAPPVLRSLDPGDTRIVRLPGAPRVEAAAPAAPAPAPAPVTAPLPVPEAAAPAPAPSLPKLPAMTASVQRTPAALPKPQAAPSPASRRKSPLPPDFERDSAEFCRQKIATWTAADARALFGAPKRSRPSFGTDSNENGQILAFADPSGRHHQLELDFDQVSGRLRTVFVYPWDMTWEDCERLWGAAVAPAKSHNGRTFYSYTNRRLDVLVDGDGKVVSLGLY